MSQFPQPPMPGQPYDNSMPYNSVPRSKVSGLALTSMILGILGIVTGCFMVGGLLGIVAVILGIVAIPAINRNPQAYSGKGFAIAGLITGVCALVITVATVIFFATGPALLLPSLGKSRELANRATCAANLRGITQSMNVYAADGDIYPIVGKSYSHTLATAFPGPTGSPNDLLSNKPGGLYSASAPGNVAQNFYLMVVNGQVSAKQFLCKSDPAAGVMSPLTVPGTANYYSNFVDDKSYSYSFATPWSTTGMGGWWHNDTDASLPLIADMAPANGTGSPAANTLDGMSKSANSFNHQRDGQNIGFGDGHAEFLRNAVGGQNNDNIYSANGAGGPSSRGIFPSSAGNPGIVVGPPPAGSRGNWDIILVPAADANAGSARK